MAVLRVCLLGLMEVHLDDKPLPRPPTVKSQALLAYLILHHGRPQPRERLAGLFWGDSPDEKARRSLSTAIWHIHRCLPESCRVVTDGQTVQLEPGCKIWLDVQAFEALAQRSDLHSMRSSVELYRGELLEGFYDDWIIRERTRLEGRLQETLARLMKAEEKEGGYAQAQASALRLLEIDPLNEEAHRLVMRFCCRLGRRNAALEQYERCRDLLSEELGIEPTPETTELYRSIVEGRLALPAPGQAAEAAVPAAAPALRAARSPLEAAATIPLVSREQELGQLLEGWRAAKEGAGKLVLIQGEAGIGKTRLVRELSQRIRGQGGRVALGQCNEFEGHLPYQPFVDALRGLVLTLPAEELAGIAPWSLKEVARGVPQLRERAPEVEEAPAILSDEERLRFFDGVAAFLQACASQDGLLLIFEDLHWATAPTLELLHNLARRVSQSRMLLVGTFRPEEIDRRSPLHALELHLAKEGLGQNLSLHRLPTEAVIEAVKTMSGAGEAVVPFARRLHRETEGNPLFVMETLRLLFEQGELTLGAAGWEGDFDRILEGRLGLTPALEEAIRTRVEQLTSSSQELLRVASVLGREFDFSVLSGVWSRGDEATLEGLEEMLRHRLVEEGRGTGRDYVFAHHKIQEAIASRLPRSYLQRMHAQVGSAMERLAGPADGISSSELAFHFEQGCGDDAALAKKAIAYLHKAGDEARALYAHEDAIGYYQRAQVLLERQGELEQAARTLMKLGLTYHMALDFGRARQVYDEGFDLWRRAAKRGRSMAVAPAPHPLRAECMDNISLDPGKVCEDYSGTIIHQIFTALAEYTPDGDIVPAGAEGWGVNERGVRYTFRLRHDMVWTDGVPVTARDYACALIRMLDPRSGLPDASKYFAIRGAEEYHRQKVCDPRDVGVRALDDFTLDIELVRPATQFLEVLLGTMPVPAHAVQAHGEGWAKPDRIVTNGPFRLDQWSPGASISLKRNDRYQGASAGNVEEVNIVLHPWGQWQPLLELYEEDNLDVLFLLLFPREEEAAIRQRHASEYLLLPQRNICLLAFDTSQPPLDQTKVRQALVLATDRESLAEKVLKGTVSPALGDLVPPWLRGHVPAIGLPYDPEKARRLLGESGFPCGRGFPVLEACLLSGPRNSLASQYLRSQWSKNLGIESTWHLAPDFEGLWESESRLRPHLRMLGLGIDRGGFMRGLISWFGDFTRWPSAVYDGLVERAERAGDQAERARLFRQARELLVHEAVFMPLYYYRNELLLKPWVRSYPLDEWETPFWKDVIIEPH